MEIEHIKGINNPSDYISRGNFQILQVNEGEEKVSTNEDEILKRAHQNLGHGSKKAVEYKLKATGIKGLGRKIKDIIRKCIVCQRSGFGQVQKKTIAVRVDRKNDLWEFDLVGPLSRSFQGHSYLLTMIDHATKRAEVRPLRSKEAEEVIKNVREIVEELGTPKIILTDNGKEFSNGLAKSLSQEKGFVWRYGAPYSPTTTGLIERFNRTFMDRLKKISNYGRLDWSKCVDFTVECYMDSYHRAIGCTPKEAWNNAVNKENSSYRDKYRKSYGNHKYKSDELKVGDKVLYHNPIDRENKLSADYNHSGIITKKTFGSVEIELADGRTIRSALRNVKKFFKWEECWDQVTW